MNSMYIRMLCLSGIFLGSVLGYPIQVPDIIVKQTHSQESEQDADRNPAPHDAEQSIGHGAKKPPTAHLIARLVDAYYKVVRAEQEGIIDNLIQDADDRHDNINNVDAATFVTPKDDSDKTESTSGQSDESLPEKSKRQQGWYVQYGKRGTGTSNSDQEVNHQDRRKIINNVDPNAYIFLKADSDKTVSTSGRIDDNVFNPDSSKRQQGWYIEYGKREKGTSNSNQEMKPQDRSNQAKHFEDSSRINSLSLILAREYNNKIRAAKSELNKLFSLHSGEFNSNMDFSNQQVYKKGSDDDRNSETEHINLQLEQQTGKSKRQQGWFVSYGKRSNDEQPAYLL